MTEHTVEYKVLSFQLESWLINNFHFDTRQRLRGAQNAPLEIVYGYGEAWFGRFAAAFTEFGLCGLQPFPAALLAERLQKSWAPAQLVRSDHEMAQRLNQFLLAPGKAQRIHLCGTAFQLQVWQALTCVPRSGTVSYGDLAKMIGHAQAARALGNAVAANHIALLVPCHRVKPVSGAIGNYRWGTDLKRQVLDYEASVIASAA
jgi:AraC family transcriptional regulator of adaptative response/methylated-DNA-[protein]-cysteine methyltransferase